MKEHDIQNQIRNALCDHGIFFRANVGKAWTGSECIRLPNGDMLLKQPRPFTSGLPVGFSDIFGMSTTEITKDHIGAIVGIFSAIEVKSKTGKMSEPQRKFIEAVKKNGGNAGTARCVEEALNIIK